MARPFFVLAISLLATKAKSVPKNQVEHSKVSIWYFGICSRETDNLSTSLIGIPHPSRVLFYYRRIKCELANLHFSKKSKNFLKGVNFCPFSLPTKWGTKQSPSWTLKTEYTFNRYIPDRGWKPQPDEGAPRTSCPQGLSRKARLVAIPNHSEISACYG